MFAFIPVIGPIIDGIFSIFRGRQNVDIEKIKAGVADNQTAASVTIAYKDDLGLKVIRDIVLIGPAAWTVLISWDTIMAIRFPDLMFHVAKYPPSLEFLPYAAMTFLLGYAWINRR